MAARKKSNKPRKGPKAGEGLMRVIDVTKALKDCKPGDWVALNKSQTRVLVCARDAGDLVRLVEARGLHDKVIMMFVRDPNVTYVY